jgi:hypothetical protein
VYGGSVGTRRFILLDHTINGLNRYLENPILSQAFYDVSSPRGNIYTVDPNQQSRDNRAKAWALCKEVTIGNQTKYELIVGENVDYSTTPTLPTVSFAGAILQACLQDAPTRLMFAPVGTPYYNDNLQRVGTLATPAIVDFSAPHPSYDAYYEIHIDGTRYYVHGDFEDELVSAYDFE